MNATDELFRDILQLKNKAKSIRQSLRITRLDMDHFRKAVSKIEDIHSMLTDSIRHIELGQ